jgi:hypothetical protein
MISEVESPLVAEPRRVYRVAMIGAGLCFVASVIGQIADQSGSTVTLFSRLRLWLVFAGLLTCGSALSMRSNLPLGWLIAAFSTLFAWYGLPPHWDSARMVVAVGGGVTIAGLVLSALPRKWRIALAIPVLMYHFFGIFMATTWPNPAPWFTIQIGTRVYIPYIQFLYLKNAYHFYSPEPGPAHHLFCLITYDKIDPDTGKAEADWVTMPSRKRDWRDPLGLTYFRRLSITEQSSATTAGMVAQSVEYREIEARRAAVSQGLHPTTPKIPLAPLDTNPNQYRMPRYDISRYLLPSYAAHLLHAHSTDERKAKTVKIYRVEHPLPDIYLFAQENLNPHHPLTFKPYFVGEFELVSEGVAELRDKQDPMLYWLTPILPKDPAKDALGRNYEDFMSKHARYNFNWETRVP